VPAWLDLRLLVDVSAILLAAVTGIYTFGIARANKVRKLADIARASVEAEMGLRKANEQLSVTVPEASKALAAASRAHERITLLELAHAQHEKEQIKVLTEIGVKLEGHKEAMEQERRVRHDDIGRIDQALGAIGLRLDTLRGEIVSDMKEILAEVRAGTA
jgi:hypothetical protein